MHLVKDLFTDIAKHAKENNSQKVTKVYLRMGDFSEINEEIVRFFFTEKGRGTMLEQAELSIEKSPTRELTLISFDYE